MSSTPQEAHTQQPPEPGIHAPPTGWDRLKWLGPGFLWMVSAAGSGELLFTPRVGALYGYSLAWALLAAVVLKWFINREIGRYTVCTGQTILEGFRRLPGPGNWAIWLIVLPQLLVAIATIAGLAGSAGTALILLLPGDIRLWVIGSILLSTGLVLWGRYGKVELVATTMALALAIAAVIAAITVGPNVGQIAEGLVPRLQPEVDIDEILPWLGFMLSGAAGMIWYSYWLQAKGYGATAARRNGDGEEADATDERIDPRRVDARTTSRLQGWLTQLAFDNTIAVVGTLIITLAFLVLGVELLRPEGLVPEENRVAEVLGNLLGDVWGRGGYWFMIVGIFIGFWDTVLSDQDGFTRMFVNGTRLIAPAFVPRGWLSRQTLRRVFVVGVLTILPIALYLLTGNPVNLLKLAGMIEAAHIPVLTWLTLYLNHRELPPELRASRLVWITTALAGLFFAVFAAYYVYTQF